MNTKSLTQLLSIPFILMVYLLGCSGSEPKPEPRLNSLTLTSSNGDRLDISGISTTQLSFSGLDQYGDPFTPTEVTWSANQDHAIVSQTGLVESQSAGEVTINASSDGISASYDLMIWDSSAPRTEIFVSDVENLNNPPWHIMRYFADGSYSEIFTDQQLAWPQDIVIREEENEAWVSNLNSGRITKYNLNTGEYIGTFASGISGPTRMKIGPDNLLYILQWSGNGLVRRFNLDGSSAGNFTSIAVPQGIGMDWDGEGNFYVSSFQNANIRKFDAQGNDLGIFISSNLTGPTNIWFDAEGNLLVNDWNAGRVVRFDAQGNFLNHLINGLSQPEGVDYLNNGNFLIGNGGPGEVKEYMPDGSFVKNIIPIGSNGLKQPNAVIVRNVN